MLTSKENLPCDRSHSLPAGQDICTKKVHISMRAYTKKTCVPQYKKDIFRKESADKNQSYLAELSLMIQRVPSAEQEIYQVP